MLFRSRFIASATTVVNLDYTIIDTPNIVVGTSNVIIDSFSSGAFRSARYTVSSANPYDAQMTEILLLQINGSSTVNVNAVLNTGANSVSFYSNVTGSTVNLIAKGTTAANQLRIEKTYFNV